MNDAERQIIRERASAEPPPQVEPEVEGGGFALGFVLAAVGVLVGAGVGLWFAGLYGGALALVGWAGPVLYGAFQGRRALTIGAVIGGLLALVGGAWFLWMGILAAVGRML